MRKMLILFLWFVSALSLFGQSAENYVLTTVRTTNGGYVSFTKSGTGIHTTYTPTYHFYMKDHLG